MILNSKKSNIKNNAGFTLIELMVALSIFAIVMLVSVGTLLVLVDANAKAQALDSSTTNLAFALDSVTRELRTGYHYYCDSPSLVVGLHMPQTDTRNCAPGNYVSFSRKKDDTHIGYRLNGTTHMIEQKIAGSNWLPITSSDIEIDTFDITVNHATKYNPLTGSFDKEQPTVDLHIVGHVKNNNGLDTGTTFNIQTRILQSTIDVG